MINSILQNIKQIIIVIVVILLLLVVYNLAIHTISDTQSITNPCGKCVELNPLFEDCAKEKIKEIKNNNNFGVVILNNTIPLS